MTKLSALAALLVVLALGVAGKLALEARKLAVESARAEAAARERVERGLGAVRRAIDAALAGGPARDLYALAAPELKAAVPEDEFVRRVDAFVRVHGAALASGTTSYYPVVIVASGTLGASGVAQLVTMTPQPVVVTFPGPQAPPQHVVGGFDVVWSGPRLLLTRISIPTPADPLELPPPAAPAASAQPRGGPR